MEDGVAILTQGAECEQDWVVTQFDVAHLAHDSVSIRDGEVGEAAMVFLKALWALRIGLT